MSGGIAMQPVNARTDRRVSNARRGFMGALCKAVDPVSTTFGAVW